jgi:hypothetical protein
VLLMTKDANSQINKAFYWHRTMAIVQRPTPLDPFQLNMYTGAMKRNCTYAGRRCTPHYYEQEPQLVVQLNEPDIVLTAYTYVLLPICKSTTNKTSQASAYAIIEQNAISNDKSQIFRGDEVVR